EDNMWTHKMFQSPMITTHMSHEDSKSKGLGEANDPFTTQTTIISTLDHVGTHVDAPLHVNPNGESVDELPLDMFIGKAVCLDLTYIGDLEDIEVKDLEEAEKKSGIKINGHIVLLNTGLHNR